MNDVTTTAPLDEVRGLVDERGRYEGWLSALDARRAVTPGHVFERVRGDYEARLRRVVGALEEHSGALRADEAALSEHHDERLRTLGERRDTLAEVELRTLVGEFPSDEGERQRREVEQEISTLEGALAGAAARLAELRGLLARVTPGAGPDRGGDAAPGGGPDQGGDASAGARSAQPETGGDPQGLDAARAALGDSDVHGFSSAQHFAPSMRAADARPATPPFAGQSFAEAAFGGRGAGQPAPGGAALPQGAAAAQEKTLRCPDCGAMNFPTEWYCEKCGGELAAL